MISKILQLVICFSVVFGGSLSAQDLIQRTRQKTKHLIEASPNRLAIKAKAIKSYKPVSIFEYRAAQKSVGEEMDLVFLDIQSGFFDAFRDEPVELDIPVSANAYFTLQLYPVNISSASAIVRNESGEILRRGNPGQFYHGIVKDDPGSLVAVSVFEGSVHMVLSDRYGNYNLGKLEDDNQYVLYKAFELPDFEFDCGTSPENALIPDSDYNKSGNQDAGRQKAVNECVKVYIEADYRTYINLNQSTNDVMDFIDGTFNAVKAIYDAENIPIEMSELLIWTMPDPYGADANVFQALTYLNTNINSFNGDLFHLVSAIGNTGSFAGVANVYCNDPSCTITKTTALCQADPFAVSQTQLYFEELPLYSWTVNIFSHEMGHNMGSPHTHACQWGPSEDQALDGCVPLQGNCTDPGIPLPDGGTIMSYCHQNPAVGISFSNGFGTEVGDHIRSQYAAVPCLTACAANCEEVVTVSINPVSGDFEASDRIETAGSIFVASQARFNAPNIDLNINFSVNNSATFEVQNDGCNE